MIHTIEEKKNNTKREFLWLDHLVLTLVSLYFILKPFYFWSSGLPQISDFLVISAFIIYTIKNNFTFKFRKVYLPFFMVGIFFVIYISIINVAWAFGLQAFGSFLIPITFYVYNLFFLFFSLILLNEYKNYMFALIYKSILLSVFLQFFIFFIEGGYGSGRSTAGFNNPNQLGYYGLVCASYLIVISTKISVKFKWFIIGLVVCLMLVFASLSKAAILSMLGLIIIFIISKKRNKKFNLRIIYILVISFFLVSLISTFTDLIEENSMVSSVQNRLDGIGNDSDDSLNGRGYYRITDFPQYWFLGAGEGGYWRFDTFAEFHSTLGNLQVSYGIIGSFMFLLLIFIALKQNHFRYSYIIIFIMIYGLTHNGIRNSLLWVLLALIFYNNNEEYKSTRFNKEL